MASAVGMSQMARIKRGGMRRDRREEGEENFRKNSHIVIEEKNQNKHEESDEGDDRVEEDNQEERRENAGLGNTAGDGRGEMASSAEKGRPSR